LATSSGGEAALPLLSLLRKARNALRTLARAMNAAAGWMFFACAAFITFDVLARNFLGLFRKSSG